MCGRFTLKTPATILAEMFGVAPPGELTPRYNVAPTQPVATVRATSEGPVWVDARWGLIPRWANDPAIGNRMINARAETVADKPAYREPLQRRRCLVPADGFYEWQKLPGGIRRPYWIHLEGERPFAFAGLWDRWRERGAGAVVESCALITTEAHPDIAEIHDRMPVMLESERFGPWLDPEAGEADLTSLLLPFQGPGLRAREVGTRVNDPGHDDPECLEPPAEPRQRRTLFE